MAETQSSSDVKADPSTKPSLLGWVMRDVAVFGAFSVVLVACYSWYSASPFWLSAGAGIVLAFVVAYASCYLMHEWGHYLGARLTGAKLPLGAYQGVLLGLFDTERHSRAQFQSMSLGGVLAYVVTALIFVGAYASGARAPVNLGLALGGLAFVAQSWSVDLPIIWRVQRGAPVTVTAREGAAPQVILRRTWQSWLALAALLGVGYFLVG